MRRLLRRLPLLATASLLLASCAIREDGAPRDIPVDERGNFGELATGDAAEDGSRIYLLSPQQPLLRSVPRSQAATAEDLLGSLLLGANEAENELGLTSAIPTDLEIEQARTVGTRLTIDINDALSELTDLGLRQALAQIVATASEIDQVQQVRIRVGGQNQGWPTGDGEVTDRPLTIFDYTEFLETSQPDFPALPSA
jgi:hypothetical protein